MERIWTREELEKADFGRFDKDGDFEHYKEKLLINRDMIGKSVQWCKDNYWIVIDWMVAKPTQQEPKEGDFVYVWDDVEEIKEKRIFVAKVKYGCICVAGGDEKYYNDKKEYTCTLWKNYEPIPKLTAQEIADKVGLSVEELKIIVNR